jgi:hypothetical protein
MNSPIGNIDPTGMGTESTHTDKDGNVLAVYDDGDNGIYRHNDLGADGQHIDGMKAKLNEQIGMGHNFGEKMGESLTPYSFTDFGELDNGNIVGVGKIDFSSDWAKRAVSGIVNESSDIVDYAFNARPGKKYDVKTLTKDWAGGVYYGSKLYTKSGTSIFASARDAGNFAAGLMGQKSLLGADLIKLGFGAFNAAGNDMVMGAFLALGELTGIYPMLLPPHFGENLGTGVAIDAGIDYESKIGWPKEKVKMEHHGMGPHAGRSAQYPSKK